jgi:predicted alpha/beta-fold hydrolase
MRPRTSLRLGTFLGYLTSSLLAGVFLAEGTLHPARRPISAKDWIQAQGVAHGHNSELADVTIPAPDGALLRGWSIRPRNDNGKTVILLHGLADNRIGMIGYAELFLLHGFSVLMPDARTHGPVEADWQLTVESEDIRSWFNWLQRSQSPSCIFGFGESMGAAQLLQALHAEPHFCAVAAESPFSSFREIAYDRVGQFFHTGSWLGRSVLLLRSHLVMPTGSTRWTSVRFHRKGQ